MSPAFKTCLLIDDNPLDNIINTKLIRKSNFAGEIIALGSPKLALNLLIDGAIKPDVIFLDIRMTEMDGFQFLAKYGGLDLDKTHTKIFMLSSSVDPQNVAKAKANKYVSRYLIKSLTPAMLSDLVG